MIHLVQSGVGAVENNFAARDSRGKGLLPVQVAVTGTASFRVMGRVSPDAQWKEVRPEASIGFLESISWVPYVRLEVLSGDGTATLWLGEE